MRKAAIADANTRSRNAASPIPHARPAKNAPQSSWAKPQKYLPRMGMELPARRLRPRHQDLPIHRYHASKNKTCTHRPPHRLGSYWRKIPITLIIAGVEGFWLRPFTIVIPNEVRNPHFADGLLFSVRLRCQFKAYT